MKNLHYPLRGGGLIRPSFTKEKREGNVSLFSIIYEQEGGKKKGMRIFSSSALNARERKPSLDDTPERGGKKSHACRISSNLRILSWRKREKRYLRLNPAEEGRD